MEPFFLPAIRSKCNRGKVETLPETKERTTFSKEKEIGRTFATRVLCHLYGTFGWASAYVDPPRWRPFMYRCSRKGSKRIWPTLETKPKEKGFKRRAATQERRPQRSAVSCLQQVSSAKATRNKCIASSNKYLTSSNKKLLGAPGLTTRSKKLLGKPLSRCMSLFHGLDLPSCTRPQSAGPQSSTQIET